MNDKRTLLPIGIGAVAAVLGVLGLALDAPVLGLAAGLLALGVGTLVMRFASRGGAASPDHRSETLPGSFRPV